MSTRFERRPPPCAVGLAGHMGRRKRVKATAKSKANGGPIRPDEPPAMIDPWDLAIRRVQSQDRIREMGQLDNSVFRPFPPKPLREFRVCPCEHLGGHPPKLCWLCLEYVLLWIEGSVFKAASDGIGG